MSSVAVQSRFEFHGRILGGGRVRCTEYLVPARGAGKYLVKAGLSQFPYHGSRRPPHMSYAGPVSRGRRAPDLVHFPRPAASRPMSVRPGTAKSLFSRHDGSGAFGFAAGVALGAALGVAGALLFAPQAGEDTRHSLRRTGRRLTRKGHDAWDDLRDEIRRAVRRRQRARQHRRDHAGAFAGMID